MTGHVHRVCFFLLAAYAGRLSAAFRLQRPDAGSSLHQRSSLRSRLRPRAANMTGLVTRAIPDRLVFNYKTNLLFANNSDLPAHRVNVRKTIAMHTEIQQIDFYDDTSCARAIARVHSERLAQWFVKEKYGPYKSDMCRLAMLYEGGGYYFDNDIELMGDVRAAIPPETSLATVIEAGSSGNVFQAFLASAPRHPVLMDALQRTLERYDNHMVEYADEVAVTGDAATASFLQTSSATHSQEVWMGPELLGNALKKWVHTERLTAGSLEHFGWDGPQTETAEVQAKFGANPFRWSYLFAEGDSLEMHNLKPHGGHGCCCNMFVSSAEHAIFWSRFAGAGKYCKA